MSKNFNKALNFNYDGNIIISTNGSLSARGVSNTLANLFTANGRVGISTTDPSTNLDVVGTAKISGNTTFGSNVIVTGPSLQIPTGNNAARPTGQNGLIRYNTETQQFEGYGPGSAWGSLGGVVDIAQTTKILASGTPSTTDGNLYFYTTGTERMRINSTGNVGIGTTSPGELLDVRGNLRIGRSTQANYIAFFGTSGDGSGEYNHTYIGERICVGEQSELLLFKGNDSVSASGPDRIRLLAAEHRFDTYGFLSGTFEGVGTSGTTRMLIETSGNVGIGTTTPTNTLDVTGTGRITTSLTTGALYSTNQTSTNIVGTNVSFGTLTVSGGFSASAASATLWGLTASTSVTTSALYSTNQTSTNIVGTNISVGSVQISNANVTTSTIATLLNTNTITTNISSGNIYSTTISGSNMSLSGNLNVGGTLNVVNITTTNLMDTNLTAGVARVTTSLAAVGNSNTIGSIFTTDGNVGVGVVNPGFKMVVANSFSIRDTVTTGSSLDILAGVKGSTTLGGWTTIDPNGGTSGSSGVYIWDALEVSGSVTLGNTFLTGLTTASIQVTNSNVTTETVGTSRVTSNLIAIGNSNTIGNIFTTGGNVGIGTTNPGNRLTLMGNGDFSTLMIGVTGSTYANSGISFINTASATSQVNSGSISMKNGPGDRKMQFWNDTNSLSSTSGAFAFINSSVSEIVTILNSGSVGIGTINPASKLHVEGVIQGSSGDGDKFIFTQFTNGSKIAHMIGWGLGLYSGRSNAQEGYITLNTGTASGHVERMRIDTSGNVGIGTTSPKSSLELFSTSQTQPRLILSGQEFYQSGQSSSHGIALLTGVNRDANRQLWVGDSALLTANTTNSVIRITPSGTTIDAIGTDGVTTKLLTLGNAGGINLNGNVGIGTNSPNGSLHVSLGDATGAGNIGAWDSTYAIFGKTSITGGAVGIGFNSVSGGSLSALSPGVGWYDMNYRSATHKFYVGGTSLSMMVNNSGNVGIGTSAPLFSLDVTGTARFTTAITTGGLEVTGLTDTLNLTATNITSSTLNLSSGLTSASIQVTNQNVTTETIGTSRVTTSLLAVGNSNTIGNIITTGGNVGIGTTSPGELLDVRGNLRVGGSTQANYISFFGTNADGASSFNHTYIGERIWGATESSELLLFKGNDPSVSGPDRIRLLASEHRFDTYTSVLSGTFEGVGTSGTTRMIVDNSGNVGIGTTSPSSRLHVVGSETSQDGGNAAVYIQNTASANTWYLRAGASGTSTPNGGFSIADNTAYRIVISSTGNVGIGTISPTFALDVNGTSRVTTSLTTGALYSTNQTSTNIVGTNVSFGSLTVSSGFSAVNAYVTLYGLGVSTNITTGALYSTNQTSTNIVGTNISSGTLNLTTNLIAVGNSNTLGNIITTGGNVGIGTTSPGESLDVRGNLRVGGSTQSNYISFLGTSSDPGSTHSYIGERIWGNTESSELLIFKGNDIDPLSGPDRIRLLAAEIAFETYTSAFSGTFEGVGTSGGTRRLTITTTGNVGIGTNTPSFTLDVTGTARVSNSITTGGLEVTGLTDTLNLTATNISSGTLNLSTGLTSASIQATNLNATTETVGTSRITTSLLALGNSNTLGNLFTTGGNVGIGTTTPSTLLDVNGEATFRLRSHTPLKIEYYSALGTFPYGYNQTSGTIFMYGHDGGAFGGTYRPITIHGNVVNLSSGLSNYNTRLHISDGGHIGIGTTSPLSRLHIETNITAANTVVSTLASGISDNNFKLVTERGLTTNNSGDMLVKIGLNYNYTTDNAFVRFHRGFSGNGGFISFTTDTDIERMRIDGNGNIGIGTTSPGAALHVNGNVGISYGNGLTVPGQTYTDLLKVMWAGIDQVRLYTPGAYTGTPKLTLQGDGNIGIGTTNPNSKLHVALADATGAGNTGVWDSTYSVFGQTSNTGGAVGIGYHSVSGGSLSSLSPNSGWKNMTYWALVHSFIVGGGSPSMVINNSGNIGIGTISPIFTLDVNGTGRFTNITVTNLTTSNLSVTTFNPANITTTNVTCTSLIATGNSNTIGNIFTTAGTVGIGVTAPSYTLHVNGDIAATGDVLSFASISDSRLKTNVENLDIDNSLEKVRTLRPVTFNWKDDIFNVEKRSSKDVGFIAQEIEPIIPYAVSEYKYLHDTYKNMKHERIIPYLVGAIQKLDAKIMQLEYENKMLKEYLYK